MIPKRRSDQQDRKELASLSKNGRSMYERAGIDPTGRKATESKARKMREAKDY